MFNSSRIIILGALLDQADTKTILYKIGKLFEKYHTDHQPKYLATINSDFINNMLGWSFTHPKNPELMRVLRQSDISTPDGMPLVWIANLLGCPLPERVTGQDLLPEISEMLSRNNMSVFLLGGQGKMAWKAAEKLAVEFPNLNIAGIDAPHIHTQGEWLENTFEQDQLLVENINKAKPDVLFLQLGNPKQELFFDRIREQLRVPVTVGIGGSFERYTGHVARAPRWMQRSGTEWIHRLWNEPARLGKRYFMDFCKLVYFGLPLVTFHHVNKLFAPENPTTPLNCILFLSPEKTIAVVPFPPRVDANSSREIETKIEEAFEFDVVILDFRAVSHIDPRGAALLVETWEMAQKQHKELFGLKASWNVRTLLKLNHVWDTISDRMCDHTREIIANLKNGFQLPNLFESIQQFPPYIYISFFGELDNLRNYSVLLEHLENLLPDRIPVIDLTYCISVESLGWSFLCKLSKLRGNLVLLGLNRSLKNELNEVGLFHYFTLYATKQEFLAEVEV